MKLRILNAALTLIFAVASSMHAQTLTIHLDQDKNTKQVIAEGTYTIKVTSQLPTADYTRSFDIQEIEIAPIDLSSVAKSQDSDAKKIADKGSKLNAMKANAASVYAALPPESACLPSTEDEKLAKALKGAKNEKEIAALLKPLPSACLPETLALITATDYEFDQQAPVKRGQQLVVTIKRGEETWTATYVTAGRGSFRTSYGFSFLPSRDKEFFTYALGTNDNIVDDKKFEIRRKRGNSHENGFVPTVNFSWYPAWRPHQNENWSVGPTVGLGFDFANPVVLAGVSFTYNQNLAISFGAAAQKQKRLVGQYSPGQRVKENLDSTALTDDTYAPNVYVSITIRSLTNPFSK